MQYLLRLRAPHWIVSIVRSMRPLPKDCRARAFNVGPNPVNKNVTARVEQVNRPISVNTPAGVSRTHSWRFGRCFGILALAVGGAFAILNSAAASTLPSGFIESSIVSGLSGPTSMEFAPDGRLFVCQQGGQLRVIKNGLLLAAPFVTVTVDPNGERGLLGIAFDPNFAVNHFIYVYYTATTPAVHNRVSRFTANGDSAVAGSELVLLDLNNLSALHHNGGAIHFGSDGKLYIAAGENGNPPNAQTFANLLGKILRLNPDGTIPTDNPFYSTASGVNRAIWALGLRNPFTFAVQPGSGRIFINDVGEDTWEEINDAVAGANFGWPNCEGACGPVNPAYRNPLFQYLHGTGNAIAGGAFYNPASFQFPATNAGVYFFADYASGWIRKLDPANGNQVGIFATGVNSPVDLKVGADGRLYYLARSSGIVYAITYTGTSVPQITQQPLDQTVRAGQPATFVVTSTGTLGHQWQRNGASIAGATSGSYTLVSAAVSDNGAAFRCVLTNFSGAITSSPALLHVSSNGTPTGTIISPPNGILYTAGDTVQFAGAATDPEDGSLAASAFSWTIVFHHDTHTHPFLGPLNGVTNGSFTIPSNGETAANVWYRINLTVADSAGQSQTSFSDVIPRTSKMTLTAIPPLQVTLDGQPVTTPVLVTNVVGMNRTVGAISPQGFGGTAYQFGSWSDGGAVTHVVTSPATDSTNTATYQMDPSPVANNDSYSVTTGAALNVSAPGVLSNDTDPNGQPLTAVLVSTAVHGALSLNVNGSIVFTPTAGYSGPDSFAYKANNGTSDSGAAIVSLAVNAVPPTNSFVQWARFEAAFTNTIAHADPYRDVTLNVIYTRPDASTMSFWGFYDGGTTWRIRFMPDQIGTWKYTTTFSDGAPGATGTFQCVAGNIPGMVSRDEANPLWFGFKGGGHGLLRSFHVGDRFFATNWPATNRTAFLNWAQAQGYNMLSVASHYLNRAVSGRGQGWNTPDLWDGAARALKAREYQTLETMLDDLAARNIVVFPFAGFFGKSSDFPLDQADQELYLRYTLARIAPYWNIVLAVAGPEPLYSVETSLYRNAMGFNELSRLGNLIKSLDVFGHPLTVHNVSGENAFKNELWESYTTLQGPKTLDRLSLNSGLMAGHGAKPLYAAEVMWPGDTLGHPIYSDTDIRKNGFVIMMSAATYNFGDMNGNSSSGFSGSMDLAEKVQSRHDIIKRVWDFFETQRFYRMSPRQDLVNNGFCLAEPGREYLVYLQLRGSVSVTVSNGPFQVEWINAQNTQDKRLASATTNGLNLSSPTDGDDWLLHLISTLSPPGSAAPTISNIPDQSTTMNTPTPAISFTINDLDTPAGSLTLGKGSSNPTLVPPDNIVLGGGSNRTVIVTPAFGQTGVTTITVSVSNGTNTASDTFVLTVSAVNTPPTLAGIGDQTIAEDTTTGALSFAVADAETPAASLTLGRSSSNPTLVPINNIVFGGSGASRVVTVSPAANQNGTAIITVTVSDGQFTASTNFLLTVNAINDPPTISSIANQTINLNGTTGPLSFTVGDPDGASTSLTLGAFSSNPTLIPPANIILGGSGASRTVTVSPASGQTGSATVTMSVSDGQLSANTNFVVTVSSLFTGTKAFTNTAAIAIPDKGPATPYPSTINVSGLGGTISSVTLTLRSLSHTWTRDIDVLLAGPVGQKVAVMSDAGSGAANNVTMTLSDAATSFLPLTPLISGSYKPANYTDASSGGDNYPSPAPVAPYAAALSAFNGQPANGAWALYVVDDGSGDQGSFAGGWILTVTTSELPAAPAAKIPPQITSVAIDATGIIRLTVRGAIGLSCALEASSDWVNWSKVDVQENTTGSVALSEQPTTNSSRFYRVVSISD